MFHGTKPGAKVKIVSDCRGERKADGLIGVYEGDFPRTCYLVRGDAISAGFHYDKAEKSGLLAKLPVHHLNETTEIHSEYILVESNPRIKLPDGSVIWGDECWWQEIVE